MNEISGLLSQFSSGQIDPQKLEQAVNDHFNTQPASQIQQHMQTAADNADNSGNGQLADTIRQMLAQHGGGEGIKGAAINLITSNPQILQHFAPEFTRGIMSRL